MVRGIGAKSTPVVALLDAAGAWVIFSSANRILKTLWSNRSIMLGVSISAMPCNVPSRLIAPLGANQLLRN